MGAKLLTCALEVEQPTQWQASQEQPARLQAAVVNSTLVNETNNANTAGNSQDDAPEALTPLTDKSQIRLLSFSACLMQSFRAGMIERKKSALFAAKKVSINWNTADNIFF